MRRYTDIHDVLTDFDKDGEEVSLSDLGLFSFSESEARKEKNNARDHDDVSFDDSFGETHNHY